ncbi:MAG: hypothetical protein EHM93_15480 [Bacteroidales bacterium]|nr:MAG: hypothetical protein EHM93_15480 [Bacteroidales bacterium]
MALNNSKTLFGKPFLFLLIVGLTTFPISGCKVQYSFTGASISPDVKTVSIEYFQNLATLVNPALSSKFTEALKDRFITQTSLNMVREYGDLQFSGQITGYAISPIAIQANETAAKNRLTITVRVKFENTKDKTFNFEKSFTQFDDFNSDQEFSSIEADKVTIIIDKLIDEIFNNSVANW